MLILNIIAPGIGSIVAAYYDPKGCNSKCATFGILQMLLAILIVGIVWSIVQGVAMYNKSNDYYGDKSTVAPVAAEPAGPTAE